MRAHPVEVESAPRCAFGISVPVLPKIRDRKIGMRFWSMGINDNCLVELLDREVELICLQIDCAEVIECRREFRINRNRLLIIGDCCAEVALVLRFPRSRELSLRLLGRLM